MSKKNKETRFETVKLPAKELQSLVLLFLKKSPTKRYSARNIIQALELSNSKDSVQYALETLATLGKIHPQKDDKFSFEASGSSEFLQAELLKKASKTIEKGQKAAEKGQKTKNLLRQSGGAIIEGQIDMTRTGAAYLTSDFYEEDIYIGQRQMNAAMHGDTVRVLLFPIKRGRRPEGEVVEIVKRATEHFIGVFRQGRRYGFVVPDRIGMTSDIFVQNEDSKGARDGEKVVVQVTDWQEKLRGKPPVGRITAVLGQPGTSDIEMKAILINHGFPLDFSEAAEAIADAIPAKISEQEIALRRDFRDVLTFTIDPEDARDFDDALSFKKLADGKTEIGVHIADVTHFLRPDTQLDKEAYERATSVYLVDRVLPMLPERLSNDLCSLVPREDRLTFSAVFVFDSTWKITDRWFGKTIIRSAHRFSYEAAQELLEMPENAADLTVFNQKHAKFRIEKGEDLAVYQVVLLELNRIAKFLRKQNEKGGAISFETDEVKFRLDENGIPLEAYIKARKDAHLLIENFMLLANAEVALFIEKKQAAQARIPFVYRVHDLPDMEKVAEFSRFARELGYKMRIDTPRQIAESFNGLMRAARENDALKQLESLAIRTMAKAVYTTENIGHYGLGFTHYSHFTSPIRRYSDVLAHRILEKNLHGTFRFDASKLEEMCKHVSKQERHAAESERESTKYKQVEFMGTRLGQQFDGKVAGIIERGIFVEVEGTKAEGLISFRSLGDVFLLESGRLRARGQRFGEVFQMGQKVRVVITATNLERREIEMELV